MDFAEIARYIFIGLFAVYTLVTYVGSTLHDRRALKGVYAIQNIITFAIHLIRYIILYLGADDMKYIVLYICEFALLFATIVVYDIVYPKASRLLVNNMVLLEVVGFIFITRINYDEGVRQLVIAAIGTVITFFVPAFLRNVKQMRNWGWAFAAIGFIALAIVPIFGRTVNGADLAIRIGDYTLQLSEFVKILFVLFVASIFNRLRSFKQILIVSGIAFAHIVILLVSRDLGTALIFFVAYVVMIYVATHKFYYLAAGVGIGLLGGFISSKVFSHVRSRIYAWRDPFKDYQGSGWQIARSLFSIAAGGWIGVGLGKGLPSSIIHIENDMMFTAISEEMGGIVAIAILLICLNNLILMMGIASRCNTLFYRLIAVGLGSMYGFQVFLTVGGAIKLIPLTGVTLPFVSYGGSSLIASLIVFALINGMYTMREEQITR